MDLLSNIKYLFHQSILTIPLPRLLSAFGIIFFTLFLKNIFSKLILKFILRITQKTKTKLDDDIIEILSKPIQLLFLSVGFYFAFITLNISKEANQFFNNIFSSIIIIDIFWVIYRTESTIKVVLENYLKKKEFEIALDFMPFFSKFIKISVITLGAIILIQKWGYNIGAIVAGLGIGGLAFAFAAKDSIANLFGSIMILLDKPFKIGDWIKTTDVEGTIEDIGLRSTRVRRFDKALVSVPNSKLANEPIVNFSKRNKRRIDFVIGTTYSTPKQKIEQAVSTIKHMLYNHPEIDNDIIFTYFTEFGASSLNIFIYCFATTSMWADYLRIKEDVNLKIMDIFEQLDMDFAFPSMSVYIEKQVELTKKQN